MVDRNKVYNRIELLRTAISWSRNYEKIMSIGQGIMCQQEIAAWYKVLSGMHENPKYTISAEIEQKVERIINITTNTKWERPVELL